MNADSQDPRGQGSDASVPARTRRPDQLLLLSRKGDALAFYSSIISGLAARGRGDAALLQSNPSHCQEIQPAAELEVKADDEQRQADDAFSKGLAYYWGDGVPQSDMLAAEWFYKAARKGDAYARYNLGQMYAVGCGVREDDQQAYFWLYLATVGEDQSYPEIFARERDRAANWFSPEVAAYVRARADYWLETGVYILFGTIPTRSR